MTSGENVGGAGAPMVAATSRPTAESPAPDGAAVTPRPSPAELCQDSDDLLTSRRGLAAAPSDAAAAPAPVEEAGVPFSAPPFEGGEGDATPFSPDSSAPGAHAEAPEAAASDSPELEASAARDGVLEHDAASLAAPAALTEPEPLIDASAPSDGAAAEHAGAVGVEAARTEAALPEAPAATEPAAVASAAPEPAPADPVGQDLPAAGAPQNWGAGGGQLPQQPPAEVTIPLAADPFASLPIPEDVEQAAVAASFVAWLPSEPEADEETLSAAPSADAAEPAASPEGEPAADDAPTMGVPLLAALGLTDDTAGTHTNGHSVPHSPVLDLAALPAMPASVHDQETREVAAASGVAEPEPPAEPAAAEPTAAEPAAAAPAPPAPDPFEETAATIAAMLRPSEPAGGVALAEAPLSVVTLPNGSDTADAVIELPRADAMSDAMSMESAATALAAPPAEPPAEPPAPPASSSPPPPASPAPEEGEEEGGTMTIIEHLEELRKRITIAAISILACAVVSWFFVPHFVNLLETDVRSLGFHFVNLSPLGPLGLNIKLAFVGGLILASPVVFYEIWAFVAPGLTRRERHYALPFSLIGGALFALGAATAIVIIPLALRFLVSFFPVFDLEQLLDINQYIMFITLIAVIFGITFELPIFMVGFSILGIVSSRFFIQKFKFALFIMYGVAMVITPGADFVSPIVLGTFLVALYWLGVLLIRFIGR